MLILNVFEENLLNDFFDYSFDSHEIFDIVSTDTKDTENGYEITMSMPGIRGEDVKAELKDGYLTIQATTDSSRDEEDSNRTYIRRERYRGSCSESFYIGDAAIQGDIKVKFEDGILEILVPKKEAKPAVEEKKCIAIEGQTQV